MNSIFGDATTAAPTPEVIAEAESQISGTRSPLSFRLGEEGGNVPDMDLQPPDADEQDDRTMTNKDSSSQREGVGGWIGNLVRHGRKGSDANGSASGKYRRVEQDDDDQ